MAHNPRKGFRNNDWNNIPPQNHQGSIGNWNNNYQHDEMPAPPPPRLSQPEQKEIMNPNFGGHPFYQAQYSKSPNPSINGNMQSAYSSYVNPNMNYQPCYSGVPNEPPRQQPQANVNNWNSMQNQHANILQSVPPVTLSVPTFANKVEDHKPKQVGVESEVQRQKAALSLQRTEYIKKAKRLKDELDLLKEQYEDVQGDSRRSPSPDTKSYMQNNNKLQMEIKKELKTIFNVVKMLNGIIDDDKKPVDDKDDDNDSEERNSRLQKDKSKRHRSPERRRSPDNDWSSARKNDRSSDRQGKSKSKKEDRSKHDSPERSSKREKDLLVELQKKLKQSQRRESRLREERDSYIDRKEESRSSEMENMLLVDILSAKGERSRRKGGSYRLDKRSVSSSDDNDEYQLQGNIVPGTDIHRPSNPAGTDNFAWLDNIDNDPTANRKRHITEINPNIGLKRARYDIPAEVSPNTQQVETNSSVILDKIMSLIQNVKGNYQMAPENVLPEFDPMACDQTMLSWIMKVDKAAAIYKWTDKEILKYALSKLTGVAKTWLDTLPTVIYTWPEWKQKLIESFPTVDNYTLFLTEMLKKRCSYNESLEEYYYEKLTLLNKCKIFKKFAVDCIIHGIEDKVTKAGARAAGFNEPENLLRYLQTIKMNKKDDATRKPVETPQKRCFICNEVGHTKHQCEQFDASSITTNKVEPLFNVPITSNSTTPPNILLKCCNCNEIGHYQSKCPIPKVLCTLCGKKGHNRSNCLRDPSVKNNKKRNENLVCFNCGEIGHPSFLCTKVRKTCTKCGKLGHIEDFCAKNRKIKNPSSDVLTPDTTNEFQNKNVILNANNYSAMNAKQETNESNNVGLVVENQSLTNVSVDKSEIKIDTSINENKRDIAEFNVVNESNVKEEIQTMKLDEPNVVTNGEAARSVMESSNEDNVNQMIQSYDTNETSAQNEEVIQNSNVTKNVTGRIEKQTEQASTTLDFTNKKNSTDNIELSTNNIELSTNNVGMSTNNVELSTNNVEMSTNNVEMSTNNVEMSTNNVEMATNNEKI